MHFLAEDEVEDLATAIAHPEKQPVATERWLKRFRPLATGVEFFFLADERY